MSSGSGDSQAKMHEFILQVEHVSIFFFVCTMAAQVLEVCVTA